MDARSNDDLNDIWTPAIYKKEAMPAVLPILNYENKIIGLASYHQSIGYSLHFEPEGERERYALGRDRKIELIPKGSPWPTAIQVTVIPPR